MFSFETCKYVAASRLFELIKQLPSAAQFDSVEEILLEDMIWGDTPLHIACWEPTIECVEGILLLKPKTNTLNRMGSTPLHIFLDGPPQDEVILKKLIDAGADPDISTRHGNSPLHILALQLETEKTEIFARLLVEHMANVNSQNHSEETPLHIAVDEGREHLVKILLESGASIDIPDSCGRSPMDIALSKRSQYPRILELLSRELIILYWCRCSVNSKHLEEVCKSDTSRIFNKRCEREIEQLKRTYVGDSTATYYKILVSSTHTVARFLFNTNIMVSMLEFDVGQSIFGARLRKKFEAALERHHAIKLGLAAAKNIFPILPDNFIYELIKYLDINDCVDLDKVCSFES